MDTRAVVIQRPKQPRHSLHGTQLNTSQAQLNLLGPEDKLVSSLHTFLADLSQSNEHDGRETHNEQELDQQQEASLAMRDQAVDEAGDLFYANEGKITNTRQ